MRDSRCFERAVKEHGSYAAAVKGLAGFLADVCCDARRKGLDLDRVEKQLAAIIGHIRTAPNCSGCDLRHGLSLVESTCLEYIGRYQRSKNSGLLEGLSIRVFVADGCDLETVENPLAVYDLYLRGRMLREVEARTYERYGRIGLVALN